MSGDDITVHRLTLRSPAGVGAIGLRARVEDALRVSSKPAALTNRFVLVRRLRLRMPRDASAQSLALQLEQQWRELESKAEPIASAGRDAAAVWAWDEGHARLALLRRWLEAQPCEAWFWQRLLPLAEVQQPLAQRLLSLLLEPLADVPSAGAAAARQQDWRRLAWQAIDEAGMAGAVVAAMNPAQREALRELVRAGSAVALAPTRSLARVADLPTWWLEAGREERGNAAAPASGKPLFTTASTVPSPSLSRPSDAALAGEDAVTRPPGVEPFAASEPRLELAQATAVASASARRDAVAVAGTAGEATTGATHTDWAGLWFLLPLLQAHGLAQQARPAPLWAALQRLAMQRYTLDHVARQWLTQVESIAGGPARLDELQDLAAIWWRISRTACLRQARLPLRRLLHRPGQVWFSPHRIDIQLALCQADIRIRRAGYDIDPGYVPWLDCVIRFHYV